MPKRSTLHMLILPTLSFPGKSASTQLPALLTFNPANKWETLFGTIVVCTHPQLSSHYSNSSVHIISLKVLTTDKSYLFTPATPNIHHPLLICTHNYTYIPTRSREPHTGICVRRILSYHLMTYASRHICMAAASSPAFHFLSIV